MASDHGPCVFCGEEARAGRLVRQHWVWICRFCWAEVALGRTPKIPDPHPIGGNVCTGARHHSDDEASPLQAVAIRHLEDD